MTTIRRPELQTKAERRAMASALGLPPDAFESDLHPEQVVDWHDELITLEELRQRLAKPDEPRA